MPSRLQLVLGTPDVPLVALASLVGRLPRGMAPLAVVLLVHAATGSYAAAGAAAAALAIGDGAVSPAQGRLIDRLGHARVLVPSALVYAASCAGLAVAADRAPATVLVALSAAAGMAFPPISASMKTLWPELVGRGPLLQAAYAIEALIQQMFFLAGPLLVAAIVAVGSPRLAVVVTGALAALGTAAFAASPASLAWRGGERERRLAGALGRPGVRAVVAVTAAQSVVFGALYVAIPAFASAHGRAGAAGVLLALLNVGALAGGILIASRSSARGAVERYLLLSLLLAASVAPLALARSIGQMGLLLVVAGAFVAPTATASYVLVDLVASVGSRTEAFTWMSTAVAAGTAIGSAAGGTLAEYVGVGAALGFAGGAAAAGAGAAYLVRGLLRRQAQV